jgi:hypothetical protein
MNQIDGKVIRRLIASSVKQRVREKRPQMLRRCRFYEQHLRTSCLPGWPVQDTYWRNRKIISQYIFFELDSELSQLESTASVDRPFICIEAEVLLETSHSLLNRQRIIQIMLLKHLQEEHVGAFLWLNVNETAERQLQLFVQATRSHRGPIRRGLSIPRQSRRVQELKKTDYKRFASRRSR